MAIWLSVLSSVLLILISVSTFYIGTNGGKAWTSESARRLMVKNNHIDLPPFLLIDQNEAELILFSDDNNASSSLIFIEFIYTECPTICLAMGAEFYQLQNIVLKSNQPDTIKLLSISFDPKDQSSQLALYLDRFAGNQNIWSAAKFSSNQQLNYVMDMLGVIAIPEKTFGYVHNAAVYVVNNGAVVAILDHDDHDGIQAEMDRYLGAINYEKN